MALRDFLDSLDKISEDAPVSGKYGSDPVVAELMDWEDAHPDDVEAERDATMAELRRRGLAE